MNPGFTESLTDVEGGHQKEPTEGASGESGSETFAGRVMNCGNDATQTESDKKAYIILMVRQ